MRVQTELGDIVLEIDPLKAPNTAANFLKYVDAHHYDGGVFHRTVKPDNQADCLAKFHANRWIGWLFLAGILAARY